MNQFGCILAADVNSTGSSFKDVVFSLDNPTLVLEKIYFNDTASYRLIINNKTYNLEQVSYDNILSSLNNNLKFF